MTHTLAHAVAAHAERRAAITDPAVYLAAGRAHARRCYRDDEHTHGFVEEQAARRAAAPAFKAAVDAAVAAEQANTRRAQLEAERLRLINLGALVVLDTIDVHANPGHIAHVLGGVRLALGSSLGGHDG